MKPWRKFHTEMLTNPRYFKQAPDVRLAFYELLLISDDDGAIPEVEQAAYALHCDEETLEKAVAAFIGIGWIEDDDGLLRWSKWQEYQVEKSTKRVRRHRERKRDVTPCNVSVTPCNVSVTHETPPLKDKIESRGDLEEKRREESKAKAKTTHAHACDPPPLLKPEKKKGKSPSRKIVLSPADILKGEQVEQLFETWKAIYWGDQSTVRLTPGRDQVLRYHLEHYGFEDTLKAVVGLSFDRWLSERMKEGDRHHIQLPHMLRNDERIDEGVALFNANKVQAAPLMPVDYLLEKVADWRHLSQWKILDRLIGMEATIDHYPEPGDSPARYRGFALEILQAHFTGGLNGKAKDVRTRWTGAGLPQPPQSMDETADPLVEIMGRLGG